MLANIRIESKNDAKTMEFCEESEKVVERLKEKKRLSVEDKKEYVMR